MEKFIELNKYSVNENRKYGDNLLVFIMILIGLGFIFSYGVGDVSAAPGDVIYVNGSSGNDSWDGQSAIFQTGTLHGPKYSIKNATGTITSGGTVYIANGAYKEHNINIDKYMNIIGENQRNTIINGTNSGQIFYISGLNVTIINLTLTQGIATNGGGIYNQGNLTLKNITCLNNTITGNGVGYGGAIFNDVGGNLTITDSNFTDNSITNTVACLGGAITNRGTLNVTNSVFTNNTSTGTMCGGGGAIYNMVGNLTVINCTFTNNKATTDTNGNATGGGAIYNAQGIVVITSSNFNNNSANGIYGHDNGGGAIANYYYGNLSVKNSTFTNNHADGDNFYGGAIYNSWYATTDIHFNRFYGNLAVNGSAINCYSGSINAENNWWGSNQNPEVLVSGNVNVTPWLVLNLNANPVYINNNETSNITADLLHDSNGGYHDPANGHVPDGIVVNFSSDALGTVNPLFGNLNNGMTSTTFKAGLNPGISTITSTVDDSTSTTNITINGLPPVVTGTYPLNNTFNIALNKVIQINFNKPIKLATNPWIEFKTSNGIVKPFTVTVTGNTLNITPKALLSSGTKYIVILHTNSVISLDGTGLSAPYSTKFTTTLPPLLISTNPVYNAVNVAVNKVIQINFNKPIKLATNAWIELKNQYGTAKPFTATVTGNTLNIAAKTLFAKGTQYKVTIHSNSVTSTGGAGLSTPYTTKFTTTIVNTKVYSANGVSFNYPANWYVDTNTEDGMKSIFVSNLNDINHGLSVFQVSIYPNIGMTDQEAFEAIQHIIYPSGYNVISKRILTLNGIKAYETIYTINNPNIFTEIMKSQQILLVKNNNSYSIDFLATLKEFDAQILNLDIMLNNFKIL